MNMSQVTIDILNNPRFEGAISSIEWLTDYIDVGFGMAITLVAFLIILVAMFKNVLAAAYCAYPKFWNKVNDAHTKNKDAGIIKQIQEAANGMKGGTQSVTVGEIIMGVLPDIKAMTDFEADTLSPKTYFMKAIPQMIVCVIIGAFIYNGYYRDVTSKVVDVGSTLLQRTLLECDPVAMYDQFTGSAGRPVFTSDNATDSRTQLQNKIATSVYTSIIGTYTDIKSADAKRTLADECDRLADSVLQGISTDDTFTDDAKWKPTLTTVWSSRAMTQDELKNRIGYITNKDGSKLYQHAACVSITNYNVPTTQTHAEYENIVIRIVFEPAERTGKAESYKDLVLYVGTGSSVDINPVSGANYTLSLPLDNSGTQTLLKTSDDSIYLVANQGTSTAGGTFRTTGWQGNQVYTLYSPIKLVVKAPDGTRAEHEIKYIASSGNKNVVTRYDSNDKMKVDGVEVTEYSLGDGKGLGVVNAP